MLDAALAGFGLAYVAEDLAHPHLTKGRLTRVLEDWCPPHSGYHLYPCWSMRCATAAEHLNDDDREDECQKAWDALQVRAADKNWVAVVDL
jgi:DNA-binding transcriptional LysR family regulator